MPDGDHVFVDETKAGTYRMVATTVSPRDLAEARAALRRLRHRGSDTIHMRSEGDRSRRRIVDGLVEFGFSTTPIAVSATGLDRPLRQGSDRERCFNALLDGCIREHAQRLVTERDDSVVRLDERLVREARFRTGAGGFDVQWLTRHEEPLLWVSDAVAWCLQRGGPWRGRVAGLVRSDTVV